MVILILLLSVVTLLVSGASVSWVRARQVLEAEIQIPQRPNYYRIATLERQLWGETWHHGNALCKCDSCAFVTELKKPKPLKPLNYGRGPTMGYGYGNYGPPLHHSWDDWSVDGINE